MGRIREKLDADDLYQVGQNPLIKTNYYYLYLPLFFASRTSSLRAVPFYMAADQGRSFSPGPGVNVDMSMPIKIIYFPLPLIGLEIGM